MFGVGVTTLTDVLSVITEILDVFLQSPVVYFVMLALIGGAVGIVKRLIPTKR